MHCSQQDEILCRARPINTRNVNRTVSSKAWARQFQIYITQITINCYWTLMSRNLIGGKSSIKPALFTIFTSKTYSLYNISEIEPWFSYHSQYEMAISRPTYWSTEDGSDFIVAFVADNWIPLTDAGRFIWLSFKQDEIQSWTELVTNYCNYFLTWAMILSTSFRPGTIFLLNNESIFEIISLGLVSRHTLTLTW